MVSNLDNNYFLTAQQILLQSGSNSINKSSSSCFKSSSFTKHFLDDASSEDEDGDGGVPSFKNAGANSRTRGILEIINDDDEDKIRTSSNDIQVKEEVFNFLRRMDLEFLAECFTGEYT